MISASFMQVSDAHLHRRNRRRSASVRYPEEANTGNIALDIKTVTKLGELALQHQASAQHQQSKSKPDVVVHVFFGPFFLG